MRKVTDAEILDFCRTNPGWGYEDGELIRYFRFKDFAEGMALFTAAGILQQELGQDARYALQGTQGSIALRTTNEDGVTDVDLELAHKISAHSRWP